MDEKLTMEQRKLLERVYNLRGDESVIISSFIEERTKISDEKKSKEERLDNLQNEIHELETEKANFIEQKKKFVEDFKDFSRGDYEVVLSKLSISFDPKAMITTVEEKAPEKQASMEKRLETKKKESENLNKDIDEAQLSLEQIEQNLVDAKGKQEQLNNLINEALSNNKQITPQQVEDILTELNFSQSECKVLETILIVYQDTLHTFDELHSHIQTKTETSGKQISDLLSEARGKVEEEQPDNKETADLTEVKEEQEEESTILDVINETPVEEVEEATADAVVVANNLRILTDIGCESDERALNDSELASKVELLYAKGKKALDIKYQIETITSMSYDELNNAIMKIEAAGINISDIPLEVLGDVDGYLNNISKLNEYKVVPDNKELQNHSSAIVGIDTEVYATNLELAEQYGVKWQKPNGKFSLDAIAQTTGSLVTKMDQYIEAGEDDVLRIGTDFLAKDPTSILSAIKLVQSYGAEYKTSEKYKALLASPTQLESLVGSEFVITVPTEEENNAILKDVIGAEKSVDAILTGKQNKEYYTTTMSEDLMITYQTLAQIVEGVAEENNELTYTIAGAKFSKRKFKRNLEWLLNNAVEATNEELIIAALATDSNKTEEELKKVVNALGFNVAMGGR